MSNIPGLKVMMRVLCLIIITVAFISMSEHSGKYPDTVFFSPVKREIKLSGTFGELRTNHFHAGLDIKSSNGMSGDPIYSACEGFVSRIKIDAFGYGNALYIDHPNGFTTLYAHLDRFSPEIQAYVLQEQYRSEEFEIDLCIDPAKFPLTNSQLIGYMGNTGFSFGPHLHFEIRHTDGQVPVNPLHFGYDVADQKPPVIQQLIVYEYDNNGKLINSKVMQPARQSAGGYGFSSPIVLSSSKVSFGVRAYDTQDGASNQNGVYRIDCRADGEAAFGFAFDEIPFEHSRCLNAHIDYKQKLNQNLFFHRCHSLEGNKLPIYTAGADKGIIYINPEQSRHITLDVSDFNGNVSKLSFDVRRDVNLLAKPATTPIGDLVAIPDEVNIISKPGIQVVWPKGSFYERVPVQVEVIPSDDLGCYSSHFSLSPVDIPVHDYFDINIEGLDVPAHLADKVFIARCEPGGGIVNCGGNWVGNNLYTSVRQMSTYTIMTDTIAPKVSVVHFGPKMTDWSRMAFKISDNFRTRDRGRDLLFDAWVDDRWILMTLDGKTGTLTHHFDGSIPPGEHVFRLKLVDDRGNETILEKPFIL